METKIDENGRIAWLRSHSKAAGRQRCTGPSECRVETAHDRRRGAPANVGHGLDPAVARAVLLHIAGGLERWAVGAAHLSNCFAAAFESCPVNHSAERAAVPGAYEEGESRVA